MILLELKVFTCNNTVLSEVSNYDQNLLSSYEKKTTPTTKTKPNTTPQHGVSSFFFFFVLLTHYISHMCFVDSSI